MQTSALTWHRARMRERVELQSKMRLGSRCGCAHEEFLVESYTSGFQVDDSMFHLYEELQSRYEQAQNGS